MKAEALLLTLSEILEKKKDETFFFYNGNMRTGALASQAAVKTLAEMLGDF